MSPEKILTPAGRKRPAPTPDFTVEKANRALVLIRRIVTDIVTRYAELVQHRAERDRLVQQAAGEERIADAGSRVAGCVEELNLLNRELLGTGCVLKDWRTGLVDFPGIYRGRRVWLCWRLGEPTVSYWHDLQEGYAGRRPVEAPSSPTS
ncbi:MAG: DUF2203 domain-containing protein [Planctomycetota bacterium]